MIVIFVTVVLMIPSKLQVPYDEHVAVQTELGVNSEDCIVWPPLDIKASLKDDHLPYIMFDIVKMIR